MVAHFTADRMIGATVMTRQADAFASYGFDHPIRYRATPSGSHAMPVPGFDDAVAWPSAIASGSARIAFAQSTYSSQCAVGVAASRWALASGNRCDDISTPR